MFVRSSSSSSSREFPLWITFFVIKINIPTGCVSPSKWYNFLPNPNSLARNGLLCSHACGFIFPSIIEFFAKDCRLGLLIPSVAFTGTHHLKSVRIIVFLCKQRCGLNNTCGFAGLQPTSGLLVFEIFRRALCLRVVYSIYSGHVVGTGVILHSMGKRKIDEDTGDASCSLLFAI